MFKMRTRRSVRRYHCPAVAEYLHRMRAEVDHRLYGQRHARLQLRPSAAAAEIRDLRLFMHLSPDPVPDEIAHNRKPMRFDGHLHGMGDVPHPIARSRRANPRVQCILRHLEQLLHARRHHSRRDSCGIIANKPVQHNPNIQTHNVAVLHAPLARNPVHHFFIHRHANIARIPFVSEKRAFAATFTDQCRCGLVQLLRRPPRLNQRRHRANDFRGRATRHAHLLDLGP